jgi:hypothetical protein
MFHVDYAGQHQIVDPAIQELKDMSVGNLDRKADFLNNRLTAPVYDFSVRGWRYYNVESKLGKKYVPERIHFKKKCCARNTDGGGLIRYRLFRTVVIEEYLLALGKQPGQMPAQRLPFFLIKLAAAAAVMQGDFIFNRDPADLAVVRAVSAFKGFDCI